MKKIRHEDKQVERWVNEALEHSARVVGNAHSLFTEEIKHALAAQFLIGIFAAQEIANGERFRAASEALLQAYAQG